MADERLIAILVYALLYNELFAQEQDAVLLFRGVPNMTARTYPGIAVPELTDSQIKDIFAGLDANLNDVMLTAFLYGQQIYCHTVYFSNQCFEGIYTGVVAVTLWAVGLCSSLLLMYISLTGCLASRNNCQNSRKSHLLVFIILLLYLLRAYDFYCEWEQDLLYFITPNENTSWEAFESNNLPTPVTLTTGIGAILSTVLADATLARGPILFACLLAHEFLDMALLDCLGSIMARRVFSDCLHHPGDRYIFEFMNPMIYDSSAQM